MPFPREWPWDKIGYRLDEVDTYKKKNLLQTMTRLAIGTVLGRKGSYGLGENPAWSQKVIFIIGLIFYKKCDLHCTYMVL